MLKSPSGDTESQPSSSAENSMSLVSSFQDEVPALGNCFSSLGLVFAHFSNTPSYLKLLQHQMTEFLEPCILSKPLHLCPCYFFCLECPCLSLKSQVKCPILLEAFSDYPRYNTLSPFPLTN